uniref:MHC class I-like antigen recognition-like domain-containing protein n=1 Tax=Mus spicilegus TaxID=10103 RepID=A0A8C6HCF2_MUSSI
MGPTTPCATLLLSGSHRALSAGSHSLRYLVTMTVSGPGLRDSHVFIVAYMNYMQFMRFDSDGTTQRIQARGPWVKQMGPAYLEMERRKVESYSHRAQENLRFAIQVYNQSDNASHTFQCLIGCNMGPDRRLLRGHHRHAFDGSYYIILNSDQKTWTEADSTAQITQRQWKAEGVAEWLLRHLEIGKETLQRSEPPPPWPVVGITVGVVLLGVIIIGALIAIVMTRKKRAGREGIGSCCQA